MPGLKWNPEFLTEQKRYPGCLLFRWHSNFRMMEYQTIITYLILAASAGYTLFALYRSLIKKGKSITGNSCNSLCSNCDAGRFREEIKALSKERKAK